MTSLGDPSRFRAAPGRIEVTVLSGERRRSRDFDVSPDGGALELTLEPRLALRLSIEREGLPFPMPADWWQDVVLEPLEGSGRALGLTLETRDLSMLAAKATFEFSPPAASTA